MGNGRKENVSVIKQVIKSALSRLGFEVRRKRPFSALLPESPPRLENFFQTWKRHGPKPSLIIDVGANRGTWTRLALKYFPDSQYLLVEPQARLRAHACDLLGLGNVRWLTAGVSDQTGHLLLTLPPRDDTASFRVSPHEARQLGLEQVDVPVYSLNDIVAREAEVPSMVKIDAEGFDLLALRGASDLLGKTDVIFVECGVCCRTIDNSLHAVCAFMDSEGYRVFDITDLNHSPKHGVLWLCELVFVRNSLEIWDTLQAYA
jgi:FkbM family methyltransferase